MSVTNLILFIALVGRVASYNEVVLKPWQTNLTTNSGTAVALGSLTTNSRMMAAAGNILYFWFRANRLYFDSPGQQVSLSITILDAKISRSGINVAVIGNTTKLYFLAKQSDNYTLTQTIELTVLPTALTWGFNSQTLMVGLSNGSITVFTRQPKS